jgi:hypothetical protein
MSRYRGFLTRLGIALICYVGADEAWVHPPGWHFQVFLSLVILGTITATLAVLHLPVFTRKKDSK